MMLMPHDSVRGRIREWISKHAHLLGDNILEVGSRIHDPSAWWINNRDVFPAGVKWTGLDMQEGQNVDVVADLTFPSFPLLLPRTNFSGILCSEVLEHVSRPWQATYNLFKVLKPGGWIVIT